mmetsp:Transcript_62758/g.176996  ORF Transcript_62758/g.176996 Transcript_62758/m.176996 type:complete len:487 (+) Transcript_62758:41-1501(+)
MDPEALTSPRLPDATTVCIDEREGVGRFLRLTRPVRRGEALLVESPLFITPTAGDDLDALLEETCDPATRAALPERPDLLSPTAVLSLVIAKALLENADSQVCEEFRELRGDTDMWASQAQSLYASLREDFRAHFTLEAVGEIFAIVAQNAHQANDGRAGVFRLGSYAEHSCEPSAFKEIIASADGLSRPASPACCASPLNGHGGSTGDASPGSPTNRSSISSTAPTPQLVIRAQHDLADGDVVSISYIPEYLPTWSRKQLLLQGYGFTCSCDRCERKPEVVCAFKCPKCEEGVCSPATPVSVAKGDFLGHPFSCDSCGDLVEDPAVLAAFSANECCEVISEESTQLLHPFHYKIFGMYLHNIHSIPAIQRVEALESLGEAQRRLTGSDVHPLHGRLCELAGAAYVELGDHHQAVASLRRAEEHYALSHRGPPDPGHALRCHAEQMKVTPGPLGTVPSRLSISSMSPLLPPLREGDGDEAEDEEEG